MKDVRPGVESIVAADHAESMGRQPWPVLEGRTYFFEEYGIGMVVECNWWGCLVSFENHTIDNQSVFVRYGRPRESSQPVPIQWRDLGGAIPILPQGCKFGDIYVDSAGNRWRYQNGWEILPSDVPPDMESSASANNGSGFGRPG